MSRSALAEAAIIAGAAPVLLVTIVSKVATWRLSTEPLSVVDTDGDVSPLQFHPALLDAGDVDALFDAFGIGGAETRSMSLRFVLPDPDAGTLAESRWYALAAAVVEVALIWPGQTYSDRVRIIGGGRVVSLRMGVLGQPTEITVDGAGAVAAASAVDASRDMGHAYDAAVLGFSDLAGRRFPLIVGRGYKLPVFKIGILYDAAVNAVILAGEWCPFMTAPTFYEDGSLQAITVTMVDTLDPDDGHVRLATVATGGEFEVADGAYTASYPGGAVTASRNRGAAAVGAADVVEWCLTTAGVAVDWDATARALALLRDWDVYLYLDREADTLRVLRERVLPWMPLRERNSGRGIVLDFVDPTLAPAEFDLTVGRELLDNAASVEMVDIDACRNSFSLSYALDYYDGVYDATATLGATTDERCRYSQQIFGTATSTGVRTADPLSCNITSDATTAGKMLRWQSLRLALPRRLIGYDADPSLYWMREGMVGRVTDAARSLSSALAVVRTWRPAGRPWRATFEIIDRPPVSRI